MLQFRRLQQTSAEFDHLTLRYATELLSSALSAAGALGVGLGECNPR
jgi:hypothetical protein